MDETYISREALIRELIGKGFYPAIVKQAIAEAPAANVAPVVRCKECKFYEEVEYYPDGTKKICRLLKRQFYPDDFCSYGERKEK